MALISSLKGSDGEDKPSKGPARSIDDGPPGSIDRPKPASAKSGSLFQQSTSNLMDQNMSGLGADGGAPQVIANQALAQILTGVKTLSTILPGLVPVLADLTGRLTMIVPQMMNDMTNGGQGLVPQMGMAPPMPGMPPMGGGMVPPGAGMGAPPMSPGGDPMAGGGPPMGPPPGMPPMMG